MNPSRTVKQPFPIRQKINSAPRYRTGWSDRSEVECTLYQYRMYSTPYSHRTHRYPRTSPYCVLRTSYHPCIPTPSEVGQTSTRGESRLHQGERSTVRWNDTCSHQALQLSASGHGTKPSSASNGKNKKKAKERKPVTGYSVGPCA